MPTAYKFTDVFRSGAPRLSIDYIPYIPHMTLGTSFQSSTRKTCRLCI